ncbi:hypothetical protein AMQ83_03930, partial [Paenibacillus riograndensis]
MSLLKSKLIVTLPVIVIAVIFIFSLAMIPSLNPAPRNLPIAIVNEDQGLATPEVNTGGMIVSEFQSETWANPDGEPAVKWIEVCSEAEVKAGLDNQKYYAALVISKGFSEKQASLMTPDPSSPRVQIYINQGMNASASSMAGQMLNQAVHGMNEKLRAELLAAIGQQGGMLSTKQAAALASPIVSETINVNAKGTRNGNGNSPVLMLQPLWMASLIGNVVFLLVKNKQNYVNRKERVRANIIQISWVTVIALSAGFIFTWFVWILGLHISHFTDTAIFLAIAYLAFFLMIAAVFALIGLKGMIIFVLLLFFGAPRLSFGPDFLSPFSRDWLLSWLPCGYLVSGWLELRFFGPWLGVDGSQVCLIW